MEIRFITNREDHPTTIPKASLEECQDFLNSLDLIGLDTENSSLFPLHAVQLLLQLGNENLTYVIDRTSVEIDWLNKFSNKTFIGQNLKYDYQILKVAGVELRNLIDLMIAEQCMGMGSGRSNSLDSIIERRLKTSASYAKSTRSEFIGARKGFLFEDRHIIYAAEDIKFLIPILEIDKPIISKLEMDFLLDDIEYKLIPILGDSELEGIKLNVDKWKENIIKNKKEKYKIELQLDEELAFLSTGEEKSLGLKGGKFTRKRNDIPDTIQTDLFGSEKVIKVKNKANVNYGSPEQVKKIFKELGEPVPADKYGKESVGVEHLEKYIIDNPDSIMINFIKLLIKYSDVSQKIDAFGEGHISIISPISGKLHTIYRQATAVTGRFQSGDMKRGFFNSQQIPADNDYRHCFYTDKGYKILTIDLSSAELIILGSLAKDPKLLELQAKDIHSYLATAAYNNILLDFKKVILARKEGIKEHHINSIIDLLSGKKEKEKISFEEGRKILQDFMNGIQITISKTSYGWLRDGFKSVVYGLMYGATAMRISEVLGINKGWAEIVLKTLREELPITFKYLDKIAENAVKNGYVILSERSKARRWFQNVLDAKKQRIELSFGAKGSIEREAKNAPIQSTNAYIIKEAIVRIENEYIKPNKIDAKLLMQVHDELVYKFPENIEEEFSKQIHYLLTDTASRYLAEGVSMGAAYHVGYTWHK